MNKPLQIDSSKAEVQILLDVLTSQGVKEFVCSPGSRNTPLIIATSGREDIKLTMIVDERTAAFVALGKSIVSRSPVALICTSGSAPLNYAPALSEAFFAGIPLIAITADRPKEWIDQDDSQTINQEGIFTNFVKESYDIPTGRDDADFRWFVNRIANEGVILATSGKPGPVHFNFRFDSPLGSTSERIKRQIRTILCQTPSPFLPKEQISVLADYASKKRILLIAGFMSPDSLLQKAVAKFLSLPNVNIMAETISNLHLEKTNYSIDSALCHLDEESLKKARPELVISIGGALVSRRLKEWLRRIPPEQHWQISLDSTIADCFQSLTMTIKTEPYAFIRQFAVALGRKQFDKEQIPEYKELWRIIREKCFYLNEEYCKKINWSDLKAFYTILPEIPSTWNLFLSNGTSVRYDQIIPHHPPHSTFCNRGVSGIDGCTSTAIGGSLEYKGNTLLITGDTSFAYDIGGIGTYLADKRFRMIVINNRGGGIFRFIKSTSSLPMLEECFCLNPHPPIEGIAKAYGWIYQCADSEISLRSSLKDFFKPHDCPIILEVVTPPEESAEILRNYFNNEKINILNI